MRLSHKVNHGWSPDANDPKWEARVEREAAATTAATERALMSAERRLARAQERLEKAAERIGVKPRMLAELEAIVEERRQELLELSRLMASHGAPSTNRGRASHRGIPGTSPL